MSTTLSESAGGPLAKPRDDNGVVSLLLAIVVLTAPVLARAKRGPEPEPRRTWARTVVSAWLLSSAFSLLAVWQRRAVAAF